MADSSGKKRGGEAQNRASKKKYYKPTSARKDGIPLGSRGILVSCAGGKENVAAREAIDVFTQLYEADHPEAAQTKTTAAPKDVAAALAQEIAELKDSKKALFYYHSTGIHSTVYVEIKYEGSPGPRELVSRACQRARAEGQSGTRLCNRFYPIDTACYASLDKIREAGAALVAQHFPAPEGDAGEAAGLQFAVQYEHRAAPQGLERMDVINAIVDNISTPPHKVNLTAPDKTILVNVLKTTCGLSVVDDFKQLLRYNVRLLAEPPETQETGTAEVGATADGQEAGKAGEGETAQPASQEQVDGSDVPADTQEAKVDAKDSCAAE